jgi:hypothetical protein
MLKFAVCQKLWCHSADNAVGTPKNCSQLGWQREAKPKGRARHRRGDRTRHRDEVHRELLVEEADAGDGNLWSLKTVGPVFTG